MSNFLEKAQTKKPPLLANFSRTELTVLMCADARATSRTFAGKNSEEQALGELAELARSHEAERLFGLFMGRYKKPIFDSRNCESKHLVE